MTEPPIAPLPALPTPPTAHRPAPLPRPTGPVPAQAHSDEHLLALWLHGRSAATQRAYAAHLGAFLAHVRRPLPAVTLSDVQAFQDTLATLAPATEARRLSAVKSLLSFGHKAGYLPVNVGAAIRLPPVKQTLAERIPDVGAVLHMLALERHGRNKALLRLLYLGATQHSRRQPQSSTSNPPKPVATSRTQRIGKPEFVSAGSKPAHTRVSECSY